MRGPEQPPPAAPALASMVRLLFATTNPGKLRELRRLVAGLPIQVVSPDELDRPLPEVEEDGRTFRENAAKKARAHARAAGLHALADDSGLCVDALRGAPGVHSARWSEAPGDPPTPRAVRDERNNDRLLAALAGVADGDRGAEYVAVLALAAPDGAILAEVQGTCRGRIGRARRGGGGFGYDPLFVPDALAGAPTMAELEPAEKDAISHRGEAFRAILPALERLAFDKSSGGG